MLRNTTTYRAALLALGSCLALAACNDDNVPGTADATFVDTPQDEDSSDLDAATADTSDDAATDAGIDAEPDATEGCVSNADCAGGQRCDEGTCVAVCFGDDDCSGETPYCAGNACVACTETAGCEDGDRCVDGACVGGCNANSDCGGGELCRDKECVPFCANDGDCDEDEICVDSACVPRPEPCTDDDACEDGYVCLDGDCVEATGGCDEEPDECLSAGAGRTCVDGEWQGFECEEGERCDDGACEDAPDTCDTPGEFTCDGGDIIVCNDDGEVTAIVPCDDDERCVEGACEDLPCSDADNFCIDATTIAVCDPETDVFFDEPCHPQLVCQDDACVFEDGTNVCGGDEILPMLPGEPCGDCGAIICDPSDGNALACDDPGLNICGGCGVIDVSLGDECGECGTWACGADGSLICDDPGFNGCGWCGDLEGEPGEACGDCGTYVCEPGGFLQERGVSCDDPGTNQCGGCADLPTFPGDLCEDTDYVYVCDGGEDLECARNLSDRCFTAIECNIYAARFGIVDPLSLSCDGDVGCYLKGNCSPDGIPTERDPFGSACVGGSSCTVVPLLGYQVCTGCTVGDDSTCRDGEECRELLGFISYCADPISILPI